MFDELILYDVYCSGDQALILIYCWFIRRSLPKRDLFAVKLQVTHSLTIASVPFTWKSWRPWRRTLFEMACDGSPVAEVMLRSFTQIVEAMLSPEIMSWNSVWVICLVRQSTNTWWGKISNGNLIHQQCLIWGGGVWGTHYWPREESTCGFPPKDRQITDKILSTIFCEAECIVNGRPLTKLTDGANDTVPLIPNHLLVVTPKFLLGSSITVICSVDVGDTASTLPFNLPDVA